MIRNFLLTVPSRAWLASVTAALLCSASTQATLVLPNTPFNPGVTLGPGTNIVATGSLSGTVLADQTDSFAASFVPYFTGTIRSLVVQRADTLTLDFYYQLVNTTLYEEFPNDADIFTFTVEDFGGWGFAPNDVLDLLHRTDGLAGLTGAGSFTPGTVAAITGYREAMAPNTIGFTFASDPGDFFDDPNNLAKGETSEWQVVRTNANAFTNSASFVTGTFGTATTQAYAPVPEPTAAGLLALGALAIGLRRRRPTR